MQLLAFSAMRDTIINKLRGSIMKKVCLINDIAGYGRVASTAMMPVLCSQNIMSSILPTALVSNVLDYGKFHIEDLQSVMEKTIDIWNQLNVHFDAIATGFVNSDGEFPLIEKYLHQQKNTLILIDPTMGDDGHLYPGLDPHIVKRMRSLIAYGHVITPNMTEASLLLGEELKDIDEAKIIQWVRALCDMGAKSVVITSVFLKDDPKGYMFGYDHHCDSMFKLEFTPIDARFPGTGDVFAAVLLSKLLNGSKLVEACKIASDFIYDCIHTSMQEDYDHIEGMLVEENLYRIMELNHVKS